MVETFHYLILSKNRFNAYVDYDVYGGNYAKAAFFNCTIEDYEPLDIDIPPVIIRQKINYYQILYIGADFGRNSRIRSVKLPKTIKFIERRTSTGI